MEKLQRIIHLMVMVVLIMTISNCGPKTPTVGVTNTCDILIFDSQQRFQKVFSDIEKEVDNLYEGNVPEDGELLPLINFERNNSFNSYRKLLYDIDQSINNDPDLDDLTNETDTIFEDDEIIKTLLSKDRLVIIGDSLKLYFDECLTFAVLVGKEKCDPARIQQLLDIKNAIETKNYNFLKKSQNFKDVTIENSCSSTKGDCGINSTLNVIATNCDKPSGTAYARIQAQEMITNFFNGSLILRRWKVNGQYAAPDPTDDTRISISFNPSKNFEVFDVELKYTVIPTFCTVVVKRKILVSCQECHPCNLSWNTIDKNPFNILFTFEDCPTTFNNMPVSYEIGIQYGDGTNETITNKCMVKHLYPKCVKDYIIRYSFKAIDMNGQVVCDIPISDMVYQMFKPKLCCPNKQKFTSSISFDNDTKRISYKLKHKPEKIFLLSKYYKKNNRGKFKKVKTDWMVNIVGPLTINNSNQCECDQMIPWSYSLTRSNRKSIRLKKDVGHPHYLQQGNEWKAEIKVDNNLFTVKMEAECD